MSTTISEFSIKNDEFIKKIEKELEKEKANKFKYLQSNEKLKFNRNFFYHPVIKYMKYKQSRDQFRQLHRESKLKFYMKLQKKIIVKFIRKSLGHSLMTLIFSASAFYLLSISGFYKLLEKVWIRMRGLFSRNKN